MTFLRHAAHLRSFVVRPSSRKLAVCLILCSARILLSESAKASRSGGRSGGGGVAGAGGRLGRGAA